MASAHIVVHYHELWLKKGNRRFFLHKLRFAIRRALEDLAIVRMSQPGDRLVIELADSMQLEEALQRLVRVAGIAYLGIARVINSAAVSEADPLAAIRAAAWDEIRHERFATFA